MLDISPLTATDAVKVLNRVRERLKDQLTFNQFSLVGKAIDRVVAQIDGSEDKQNELDRKVQQYLAADEDHQRWLREKPARDELFRKAMLDFDNSLHTFWEVMKLGDYGVPEPNPGCSQFAGAFDTWIESTRHSSAPRSSIQRARDRLQSMHTEYMAKISTPNPPATISMRGSGYTPIEEPPK